MPRKPLPANCLLIHFSLVCDGLTLVLLIKVELRELNLTSVMCMCIITNVRIHTMVAAVETFYSFLKVKHVIKQNLHTSVIFLSSLTAWPLLVKHEYVQPKIYQDSCKFLISLRSWCCCTESVKLQGKETVNYLLTKLSTHK